MSMPAAHLIPYCGPLGMTATPGAALLSVLLIPAVMLLRRSHKGDQPHTDEAPGTPGN